MITIIITHYKASIIILHNCSCNPIVLKGYFTFKKTFYRLIGLLWPPWTDFKLLDSVFRYLIFSHDFNMHGRSLVDIQVLSFRKAGLGWNGWQRHLITCHIKYSLHNTEDSTFNTLLQLIGICFSAAPKNRQPNKQQESHNLYNQHTSKKEAISTISKGGCDLEAINN